MRPGDQPLARLTEALATALAPKGSATLALGFGAFLKSELRRGRYGLLNAFHAATLSSHTNLLVLVDQFEEIFRYRQSGDADEADAFVNLLLASSATREMPIYIVLTMRSDYLGKCAQFDTLPEAVSASQYLVPRLTRDQMWQDIAEPASLFGGEVKPQLVNQLINEAGRDPDQLPLLQHLLMRMWLGQDATGDREPCIDENDYRRAGGFGQALSSHANEIYNRLTAEQQKLAEVLFRCLTEWGTGESDTRHPTPLVEIAEVAGLGGELWEQLVPIIDAFRAPDCSFLTPPIGVDLDPERVIDISHESLIRHWDKLKEWVQEEAQSAQMYRRIAEAAALHKEEKAGLWHDPDLQLALHWREQHQPNKFWAQRYAGEFEHAMAFLEDSKANRDAEIKAKEAQKWEKRILLGSIVSVCILLGAAVFVVLN
jgi:hypothetical protein